MIASSFLTCAREAAMTPLWKRLASVIPSGATAKESESHAIQCSTLKTDLTGRHFQPQPLSRRWYWAHETTAVGSIHPPSDTVGAPVGSMLPSSIVPLQHDLAGQVARIDVHVSDQLITRIDRQRRGRIVEVMLMLAANNAGLVGQRAGERRWISADPIPRLISCYSCPGRRRVLHPHRFTWLIGNG